MDCMDASQNYIFVCMYVHIPNKYQRLFVYAIKTATECTTYIHTYKDIKNCVTVGLFTTKLSRGPYTQ